MSRAFSQMRERHTEGGGRIARPHDKAAARKLWSKRRILVVDMADPALDEVDLIYLTDLARRLGITGKATKSTGKAHRIAQEAAERIFRTDAGEEASPLPDHREASE